MQKKQLGQCFLNNTGVALNAVHTLNLTDQDIALEIGGGGGFITDILVNEPFKHLTILEIDKYYYDNLKKSYIEYKNVDVKLENVLDFDILSHKISAVMGAIPYYITSPILHKLFKASETLEKAVLIIQKEVADKLMFSEKEGLSYWNLISFYYDKKIVEVVPSQFFTPAPKVNSATISLVKNNSLYKLYNENFTSFEILSKFAHNLFLNPRKMLHKTFNKDLLISLNIDPQLRPHQLTLMEAINLYRVLDGGNLINTR